MKQNNAIKNILTYLYPIVSLIVTFWCISLFEVFTTISKGIKIENIVTIILYKFINDFWTGLIIALLLLPIYWLLTLITKKTAHIIVLILLSVFVLIEFTLVKYSLTTLINLGADLLGYSYSDIKITVSSSESMSFMYFVPFMLFVVLFFALVKGFQKYISHKIILITFAVLTVLFGGLKLILSQTSTLLIKIKLII